jgi:branched-chain amino acid transport system substrate-binding protein
LTTRKIFGIPSGEKDRKEGVQMKKNSFVFGLICFVAVFGVTTVSADPVKVGGLFAESGTQATIARGEIIAVKMAAEEFGPVLGEKVEVIIKDHAFNAGMAVEKAKELFEREKVDAIVGCANSAASLAVSISAKEQEGLSCNS